MKRLTRQEFIERSMAITRAKKIFMPDITKNLTTAFEIYQDLLAEQDRKIFLSSRTGYPYAGRLSMFALPRCPDCDDTLFLRPVTTPKGKANRHGYRSCWECRFCGYEDYSTKEIGEWLSELKLEPQFLKEKKCRKAAYPFGCMRQVGGTDNGR